MAIRRSGQKGVICEVVKICEGSGSVIEMLSDLKTNSDMSNGDNQFVT